MTFARNEESPLDGALLIVDEASMLDVVLTNSLLAAVLPGMHALCRRRGPVVQRGRGEC
ncbi:MAG: hypothetical protein R2851_17155 [Caldilineaceae bacterium]